MAWRPGVIGVLFGSFGWFGVPDGSINYQGNPSVFPKRTPMAGGFCTAKARHNKFDRLPNKSEAPVLPGSRVQVGWGGCDSFGSSFSPVANPEMALAPRPASQASQCYW